MERSDSPPAGTEAVFGASALDPSSIQLPIAHELPEAMPTVTAASDLPDPSKVASKKGRDRPIRGFSPYRLLLVLSVGFVSLFLFIRTFAVEPFGVPTGSMAPALIGNHREGPCPRCGYPVRVGFPTAGGNSADHFANVGCPNCGKRFSLGDALDLNGDRLLVDKNVFNLRKPRRWEMAVFRCPDPDPKEFGKPYVKRVVGLPGEKITIMHGDAYANDELLRKGLAELRETRVIVFDMAYVPTEGWNARWLAEPPENDPRLPRNSANAARDKVIRDGVLTLDALEGSARVTYRNWNFDEKREEPIRAWSSYDGLPRSFAQLPAAHDFSLECEIEVQAASPEASFACRLLDGASSVSSEITVGPRETGRAIVTHDDHGALGSIRGVGLEQGEKYKFEFALVDRRATLALNGKVVLPAADLFPTQTYREISQPLQFGARGCQLVIRNLKLFRDTHYTHYGEHGTQIPAFLGRNEYFVLGDNSANSQDSRKWPRPGVPESDFVGKPFLIHQPLRPARIALGGRERVFQTVDWSRLRWLH